MNTLLALSCRLVAARLHWTLLNRLMLNALLLAGWQTKLENHCTFVLTPSALYLLTLMRSSCQRTNHGNSQISSCYMTLTLVSVVASYSPLSLSQSQCMITCLSNATPASPGALSGTLWIPTADDQAEPFRATKCPAAHSPYLVKINDADVVSRATLKGRRLDDDSIARLKALGHDIFDVMGWHNEADVTGGLKGSLFSFLSWSYDGVFTL